MPFSGPCWFSVGGTSNGLFRYDGRRFRAFGRADGLPSASISCLREGNDATLWVGTAGGLARSRAGRFEPVNLGTSAEMFSKSAIDFGRSGELYIATSKGLFVGRRDGLNSGYKFGPLAGAVQLGRRPVTAVHEGSGGALWIACRRSLYRLTGSRLVEIEKDDGVQPNQPVPHSISTGRAVCWCPPSSGWPARPRTAGS